MFLGPVFLIAGAGLAVAQSLSSNCTSTLLAVASSPNATCLDLTLLAPLALSNSSSTSIIPTVNTWLTGMCSQGPCSNATLQQVVTNITNGCSTDLASIGLTTNDTAAIVSTVQAGYPTVRRIVCLKDTSANQLCATELLTAIQSATTTLSLNNIAGLITKTISGVDINLPQNVTCSNCSKAAYTIATQNFPALTPGGQSTLQSQCGASFTNGQIPSNIRDTASNSTSSTGAAASLSVSGLNVGIAMLVAVSSTFVMFA